MIQIPYLYIAVILIATWIGYRIIVKRNDKRNIKREIAINIFFVYFLILINLTICKMNMLQINLENNFYVNYIPFVETINLFKNEFMGIGNALYNVIGNIVLFIPVGFFIPMLFNKKNNILLIALYGFLVSLTIEVIQLCTAFNLTDVDDLIFNTLGAVLGCIVFKVMYKIIKKGYLKTLLDNIASPYSGNLINLVLKPLGVMTVTVLAFTFMYIYNSTVSDTLSDGEIAQEVFQYSEDKSFAAVNEIEGYKLFLRDEGEYLDLTEVKSVFNDRWSKEGISVGQLPKNALDCSLELLYNKEAATVVVFGMNKEADKIEICYQGEFFTENLQENQYFLSVFPTFKELSEDTDINNFFGKEECKDLQIKFYDKTGNEYTEMKIQ